MCASKPLKANSVIFKCLIQSQKGISKSKSLSEGAMTPNLKEKPCHHSRIKAEFTQGQYVTGYLLQVTWEQVTCTWTCLCSDHIADGFNAKGKTVTNSLSYLKRDMILE